MKIPRYLSPLRYPGGKGRMSQALAPLVGLQCTGMDVEIWVEPFAGGAGAALGVLELKAVEEVWLVEKNSALATFWQVVVNDGHQLAAAVSALAPTMDVFRRAREMVAEVLAGGEHDPFDVALHTFVLNRCSRSGMIGTSAGPIGGWEQTGKYSLTDRWNGEELAARLTRVAEHGAAGRIKVYHRDGIDMIADLHGSGIEDELLLFVDPPYIREGDRLYHQGANNQLHDRLAAALRSCPSPWLLTYDDEPAVHEQLYPEERVLAY